MISNPHSSPVAHLRRSARSRLARLADLVVDGMVPAGQARADQVIDLENNPNLPAQPNNFAGAGAMQTYSQAGVYSISGGVVLGNPNFLAAFATQGSAPNLYGTADFADPSLQATISLALPTAEGVTSVSGVFFNGQSVSETYTLTAMSGGTTVATQTFTLAAASSTSDYYDFAFSSTTTLPITSVTFTTPNADTNGYDFFVDTIHIVPGSVVPEPSTYLMIVEFGLVGFVGAWFHRKRAAS